MWEGSTGDYLSSVGSISICYPEWENELVWDPRAPTLQYRFLRLIDAAEDAGISSQRSDVPRLIPAPY